MTASDTVTTRAATSGAATSGTTTSGDPGQIQKTVAIVRTVAAHPDGIGLSELARACGVAKATCYRILTALEREGWIVSDPVTKRSRLSLDLILMTESVATGGSLTRYVRDVLADIAAATGETAGIDTLTGSQVTVLMEASGPHLIGHAPRPVPRLLSSWRTSTGRVLLAFNDPELGRRDFDDEVAAGRTTGGFASYDDFVGELERVRAQGYAVTRSQLEEGLTAIAAPVLVDGVARYAVWTSGPNYRLDERIDAAVAAVTERAARLARLLERAGTDLDGRTVRTP